MEADQTMQPRVSQPLPTGLLPTPDRDSQPWWDALAAGDVQVQACDACGHRRWPPRAMCSRCGSFDASWDRTTGTGVVVAHTTTHHAFVPGFTPPYHTVLVRIDVDSGQDDMVMPGGWDGEDAPAVGDRVRAEPRAVEADGETSALLFWRPTPDRS